jgi:hypothetical protein
MTGLRVMFSGRESGVNRIYRIAHSLGNLVNPVNSVYPPWEGGDFPFASAEAVSYAPAVIWKNWSTTTKI